MRWQSVLPFLSCWFHVTTASFDYRCKKSGDEEIVKKHLAEAKEVAERMVEILGNDDWKKKEQFGRAWNLLFRKDDASRVKEVFEKVVSLEQDVDVTFFCDTDYVKWSDEHSAWIDSEFTPARKYLEWVDGNQQEKTLSEGEVQEDIYLHAVGKNKDEAPTERRASHALFGAWHLIKDSEGKPKKAYDYTGQAHVFYGPLNLHPEDDEKVKNDDLRLWKDVVNDGPKEEHRELHRVGIVTHAVLHELIHVAGGRKKTDGKVPPAEFRAEITDGIPGAPPGQRVYGLIAAYSWNRAHSESDDSHPSIKIAEAYVNLAKLWYLQLKKNSDGETMDPNDDPTLWFTGKLDTKTLKAVIPKKRPADEPAPDDPGQSSGAAMVVREAEDPCSWSDCEAW